jgi:hypothetical protein
MILTDTPLAGEAGLGNVLSIALMDLTNSKILLTQTTPLILSHKIAKSQFKSDV